MAYEGYLMKIKGLSTGSATSDYVIPMNAIVWESYKATYSVLDEDAKRNGNGSLKRKTYPHKVGHCKFTLRQMDNTAMTSILSAIQARYVKERQKKVRARIWIPELNVYLEDYFYIPDIEFTILKSEGDKLIYSATEVELIGY